MPASKIPEPISDGLEPFYVLAVLDESSIDREPIVLWAATTIENGCNLQTVLRQRERIGDDYGTTYVAECRIIPELTKT